MALDIESNVIEKTANVTLAGELDGSTAPKLRDLIDQLLAKNPEKLVLHMQDLTFMASAGLRVLIFAKQRAPELKIYVVQPQQPIVETLQKTGFYHGVYVVDQAPE